jgi:hypothetical protein
MYFVTSEMALGNSTSGAVMLNYQLSKDDIYHHIIAVNYHFVISLGARHSNAKGGAYRKSQGELETYFIG